MRKEILFSMNTAFRGVYNIYGYHFGEGEHAACIVGAMRGNEFQQMYICSLLSQKLALLEAEGEITADQSILLIPSLNYSAMNASRKHWLSDDTDINREFPGNRNGTATSRIAYTILERTKEYRYGNIRVLVSIISKIPVFESLIMILCRRQWPEVESDIGCRFQVGHINDLTAGIVI